MSTDSGGSVWQWRVHGRRGEVQSYGQISMWGTPDQQHELAVRWAADKMALLLWDAEPCWERLAGWRVRVWCGDVEAVACADEWLETLRGGPLARMQDRVELLPRRRVRQA